MSDVRERIEALIAEGPVVLFMKGNRRQPQCGFSARVVDILDDLLPDYRTVDVLADAAIREGIKAYSDWPTIPQLYVRGDFVGGCDIVVEMHQQGELAPLLGTEPAPELEAPEVSVTEPALAAFRSFSGSERPKVRLTIGRDFAPELDLEDPEPGDVVLEQPAIVLALDRGSARRADGLVIDYVEREGGGGFRIDNPNAPPSVKRLSAADLARWRQTGKPHLLLDVRTEGERAVAHIEGSTLIGGKDGAALLEEVDRATTLVLYCHHGFRSRAAAEHCIRLGFREVYNLEGGIDAWSQEIDPDVPRY